MISKNKTSVIIIAMLVFSSLNLFLVKNVNADDINIIISPDGDILEGDEITITVKNAAVVKMIFTQNGKTQEKTGDNKCTFYALDVPKGKDSLKAELKVYISNGPTPIVTKEITIHECVLSLKDISVTDAQPFTAEVHDRDTGRAISDVKVTTEWGETRETNIFGKTPDLQPFIKTPVLKRYDASQKFYKIYASKTFSVPPISKTYSIEYTKGEGKITLNNINLPPEKPTISGPNQVIVGKEYTYTFQAFDLDEDDIKYELNGNDEFVRGPFKSGTKAEVKIKWNDEDIYCLFAITIDETGAESDKTYLFVSIVNNKPKTPTLKGPSTVNGKVNDQGKVVSKGFTASTSDPDGHKIKYTFKWEAVGETTCGGYYTSDYKDSGSPCNPEIGFIPGKTYNLIVKAEDAYGAESLWSKSIRVTVTGGSTIKDRSSALLIGKIFDSIRGILSNRFQFLQLVPQIK